MPDLEAVCGPSRGHVKCKLATAVSVVLVAVLIACIADSYHKIHEGNVGIYYKHGALQVNTEQTLARDRYNIVKLRQGSGKDRQGMALKAKGLKA